MTDTQAIMRETDAGQVGPGRLVLVVGPSGAGKDTLIALAKKTCSDDVLFVRRVVTREASIFEDNEQVSIDDFEVAEARGQFALSWRAHCHCYGLPRTINDTIRSGGTVVANVSRSVVAQARAAYADVVVIGITAPSEILKQRLIQRGRSSDGAILKRLDRVAIEREAVPDHWIENISDPTVHAAKLVLIIRGLV